MSGSRVRECRNGHGAHRVRLKTGACLICNRAYHREYNRRFKARLAAQGAAIRRRWMQEAMLALRGRCQDCGHDDRRVLQFDHVTVKPSNVARLAGRSEAAFWREVAKCDLVCANCHVLRTRSRM